MLMESKMGGMKEMGVFYDHCLKSLYPPGSCGTYYNAHTCVQPLPTIPMGVHRSPAHFSR